MENSKMWILPDAFYFIKQKADTIGFAMDKN
jgi:hypothetical protein